MASAAVAASVMFPERLLAEEAPRKGGIFTVAYGAEQRMLNRSLPASTGVKIIGGKLQEQLVELDHARLDRRIAMGACAMEVVRRYAPSAAPS